MQTVTLPSQAYFSGVVPCDEPRVYVAGVRRRDLHVLAWQWEPAPLFGQVRLAVRETMSRVRTVSLSPADRLPDVGAEIQVRPAAEFGETEFPGVVVRQEISASRAGERLVAVAEHALAAAMQPVLLGRWERDGTTVVHAANKPPQFNTSSLTLASRRVETFQGRSAPAFDPLDGVRWSVGAALAYLLAAALPRTIEAPSAEELDRLAGAIDLGAFDATGLSLAEALAEAAHRGGLEVRAARSGLGLVIYRPGRDGRRSHLRLQPSGRDWNAAETNFSGGRIVLGRRPSRPPVRVVGAAKQYEVTLSLQPGWTAAQAAPLRWRDTLRSCAADWPARRHVFRRWVLNEHARYPHLPPFDFAILGEDFLVRRARRLGPCLSVDSMGQSLGVLIEVRTAPEEPWRFWGGPVWIDDDQCAVTLGDDALPADYFAAVRAGTAELRVTAAVESDRRIEVQIAGDPGLPAEIHDHAGRAFWRAVHPTSRFHPGGTLPIVLRDDTSSLEAFARRRSDALQREHRMIVTLGWTDTSCHVGDVVERLDGPGLELACRPRRQAHVRTVRHDFERTRQTTLILEG